MSNHYDKKKNDIEANIVSEKNKKELRSMIMKAVRSKNTKFERNIWKELWRRGYRFRKNVTDLLGKPDIAIKKYKVVIFLDSCFWHGCELHPDIPKTNTEYWINKFNYNRERDRYVKKAYESKGWNVVRIWEHQIKEDFEGTMNIITNLIDKSKNANK